MVDIELCNGLTLAYVGDSAYELQIRKHLVMSGITKGKLLHQNAVSYTHAAAQAKVVRYLLEKEMLTEEEVSFYKRGRNSHVNLTRKSIDLKDYLDSTGFEALFGYLYLKSYKDRMDEIMNIVFTIL